jgi:hypothetical protein
MPLTLNAAPQASMLNKWMLITYCAGARLVIGEELFQRVDRGLGVECVEDRFDQENVDAALIQSLRLYGSEHMSFDCVPGQVCLCSVLPLLAQFYCTLDNQRFPGEKRIEARACS